MLQDSAYCTKNGWKQQVRCVESIANGNQSFLDAESTSYYTFQACPVSFDGFTRFEAFMMLCFLLSFYYVTRRKRKMLALQQYRIAAY